MTRKNYAGSALVTRELVERAVEIARPTIEALLGHSGREQPNFVWVVVLNPVEPDDASNNELFAGSFGPAPERSTWKNSYDLIARSKAEVARRTGANTGLVAAYTPALLIAGDTHFEGGANMSGVPVGASGVESYLDEAIARVTASVINGLVKQKLDRVRQAKEAFLK